MLKSKKLFFLGSGASVCAGAPTFNNFREQVEKISNDELKKTMYFWRTNYDEYNIEEFYTAIEMQDMCNFPSEITSQDVIELITTTIEQSLKHGRTPHYYLVNAPNNSFPVITTNWDMILESYGKRLEEGLINYGGIKKHKEQIVTDGWGGNPYKILKLHGSLNWGNCEECGQTYYFDKNDYNFLKNGTAKCKKCGESLKQYIIPPTFSKLTHNKNTKNELNNIWREASGCLASCEHLYFVGYSFPETDAQMKIFVSNALRNSKHIKKITVVSNQKFGRQETDFEDRYSSVFSRIRSKPEIKFNYKGFENIQELL